MQVCTIQENDQINTVFGTVYGSSILSGIEQATSHEKSKLATIDYAQSSSDSGSITADFDSELYNKVFTAPNYTDVKNYALDQAGKYDQTFVQDISNAHDVANELSIANAALMSNDMNKIQAAGEYLSVMFENTGINNGHEIAEKISAYVTVRTNNFEEQVQQEINQDISAKNAENLGNYEDNTTSQKGTDIKNKIKSGETNVGYDAGEKLKAEKHGGYTIEQRKTMHEANIAAMKEDGDRIMNALEEYGKRSGFRKFLDWGWQDARSHWEAVRDNMDMAQDAWDEGRYGDFADHRMATNVGLALTPVKYNLAPVLQFIGDFENGTHSSQNNLGVHTVFDPELQKLLDDAVKLDEKMREYGANPGNLDTKPYNDEVAKKVGAPKYAPASAETMDLSHIKGNNADNQQDSGMVKTGYQGQGENNSHSEQNKEPQNQADKDSSGSLKDTQAVQQIKINDSNKTSYDKENHTLNLSEKDVERIIKVTATEAAHNIKDDEQYNKQVDAIVDTVLNRAALANGNVVGVINKRAAFSDINSSRKSAYGNVDNVPESRVSPRLKAEVIAHLQRRAAGEDSIIDGNTHYANPNVVFGKKSEASETTKKWVRDAMEQADKTGHKFGKGAFVHIHGTPKGEKKAPKFDIAIPQKYVDEEKK